MNNPDAPIGHHWQDATHITFGVLTAGFTHDKFKFEASAFNGTEPDENRWAFDSPKLNSFSGRFSFNPTREWAFQISHGYLKYPERSEPDLKVMRRTTASAIYNKWRHNGGWQIFLRIRPSRMNERQESGCKTFDGKRNIYRSGLRYDGRS